MMTLVRGSTGQWRAGHRPLDVLLAELEADDGPNAATLRRALDLERTASSDRVVDIEDDLETLRADVDDRAAVNAELWTAIENDLEPRLDSPRVGCRGFDDRLTALESETRGLRSELTAVRDSVTDAYADTGTETDTDAAQLDALADDLETLEQTVATAFDAVTSELETDLERLQIDLRDDIASLERRLETLEEETEVDAKLETDA